MAENSISIRLGLSGLAQVEQGLKRFFGGVEKDSRGLAAGGLQGLSSGLLKVTAAIGGLVATYASLRSVASGLKDIADFGGKLSDEAARTQISVRSLVVLRQAFQDAGIGADRAADTVNKMQKELAEAAFKGGPAAAAVERLGLKVTDLLELSPDEQFRLIAERIAAIEDPTLRAGVATEIFGRQGAELLTLFRDGGAFQKAEERLGGLPEVMARNAGTLDAISDSIGAIPNKARQFFAGVADQLAGVFKAVFDAIERFDLTGLGQRVGAFVNVAIQQFKDGRLTEFIGLTIEAGFELGEQAARSILGKLRDWLAGPGFWLAIGNALITFVNETAKVMTSALQLPVQLVAAAIIRQASEYRFLFESLADLLRQVFARVINFLAERIETLLNAAVSQLNRLLSTAFAEVDLGRATVEPREIEAVMSYAQAWEVAGQAVAEQTQAVRGFFDQSTAAARELLGLNKALTGETNAEGTALERLNRLIDEQLKKREAAAAAVKEEANQSAGLKVQIGELERLRALELQTKNQLLNLERLRAQIENDFALTEAEKFAAKRAALEEERQLLTDIVTQLRERAALSQLTDQEREQVLGQANAFDQQLAGTEGQLSGMGPDPASMEEQMTAAMTNLQNQFGTVAQSIARGFTTVIGKAVDGVASSIQGLIQGTMTWADALRNVGSTILSAVITAIAKMVAEWIVGRALIAAKEILFSTKETAAKAPNAMMTSITSYGAAAIVGLAAFAAAMAAMGAFDEGGYTGAGPAMAPAGLVHRGEFVVPADRVAEFGVGFFENIRQGTVGPEEVAPPAAGQESNAKAITVILVDSRQEAKRWAESIEGQTTIVNVVRNNRTEIGIPS